MSYNPWPSERPSTTRPSKYRAPKSTLRTDWFTGWVMTLFTVAVVAGVLATVVLPIAAGALENLTSISDLLEQASNRSRY